MSFPRAKIQRFNDFTGCAPGPGTYDPKLGEKPIGGAILKGERFNESKLEGCENANDTVKFDETCFRTPRPVKKSLGRSLSTSSSSSKDSSDYKNALRRYVKQQDDMEYELRTATAKTQNLYKKLREKQAALLRCIEIAKFLRNVIKKCKNCNTESNDILSELEGLRTSAFKSDSNDDNQLSDANNVTQKPQFSADECHSNGAVPRNLSDLWKATELKIHHLEGVVLFAEKEKLRLSKYCAELKDKAEAASVHREQVFVGECNELDHLEPNISTFLGELNSRLEVFMEHNERYSLALHQGLIIIEHLDSAIDEGKNRIGSLSEEMAALRKHLDELQTSPGEAASAELCDPFCDEEQEAFEQRYAHLDASVKEQQEFYERCIGEIQAVEEEIRRDFQKRCVGDIVKALQALLAQSYRHAVQLIQKKYEDEMNRLDEAHEYKLKSVVEAHKTEIKHLELLHKENFQSELQSEKALHQIDLKKTIADIQSKHEGEIEMWHREYALKLTSLGLEYDSKLSMLRDEKDTELRDLRNEYESLKHHFEAVQEEYKNLKGENEEKIATISLMKEEEQQLREKVVMLNSQLMDNHSRLKELETSHEAELARIVSSHEEEVNRLRDEHSKAEAHLRKELETSSNFCLELQDHLTAQNSLNESLHKERAELEAKLKSSFEDLGSVQQNLEQKIKDLQQQHYSELEDAQVKFNKEIEELSSKFEFERSELSDSLEACTLQLLEMQEMKGMLEEKLTSKEQELSSCLTDVEAVKKNMTLLADKLQEENSNIKKQHEEEMRKANEEYLEYVDRVIEAKKVEHHKLREELSKSESDIKKLTAEKEEMDLHVLQLKGEIEDLQNLLSSEKEMRQKLETQEELLRGAHEKEIETLEEECEKKLAELQALTAQETESIKSQLNVANEKLSNAVKLKSELESDVLEKQLTVVKLEDRMNSLVTELNEAALKIEDFISEKHHILQMQQKRDEAIQELEEQLQSAWGRYENEKQAREDLMEEKVKLETRMLEGEQQIRDLMVEVDYNTESIETAAKEITELREKLKLTEEECELLKDAKNNLQVSEDKAVRLEAELKAKTASMDQLESRLADRLTTISTLEENLSNLQQTIDAQEQEKKQIGGSLKVAERKLKDQVAQLQDENSKLYEEIKDMQNDERNYKKCIKELQKRLDKYVENKTKQDKQIEDLKSQQEERHVDYERSLADFQERLNEVEHWKSRYLELEKLVGPFREQLEAYEAERHALENQTLAAKGEMKQLALQYAQVLGHQNQKQKIKHMVKLKEQNLQLKDEVQKLQAQSRNQKRTIDKLKEELTSASGSSSRRFDPSKAFRARQSPVPEKENLNQTDATFLNLPAKATSTPFSERSVNW